MAAKIVYEQFKEGGGDGDMLVQIYFPGDWIENRTLCVQYTLLRCPDQSNGLLNPQTLPFRDN